LDKKILENFSRIFSLVIKFLVGFSINDIYREFKYQPMLGAVSATGVDSAAARSRGKL
jgi:hypothetical protein